MASKNYRYLFTESAEADIDLTFSYITDTLSNPDAASDLANELEEQLERICKRPETGKIVENDFLRRNDVWRFLVKNYIASLASAYTCQWTRLLFVIQFPLSRHVTSVRAHLWHTNQTKRNRTNTCSL